MRGVATEQNVEDMQARPAAEMALRHKGLIVGIKTAHYMGRDFAAVDRAVEAGTIAGIPVMVDFGRAYPEKSLAELLTQKLRPGDIYTHVYSGLRGELDPSGHANPALFEGRKRGVIFDVGHGAASFAWRVAVPIIKEGFLPDSISTDLQHQLHDHRRQGHAQRDEQVPGPGPVARRGDPRDPPGTRPARSARSSSGTSRSARPRTWPCCGSSRATSASSTPTAPGSAATSKLTCEMTLRDGKIVYELNGLSRPDWTTLPKGYRATGDPRWDGNRSSNGGLTRLLRDEPGRQARPGRATSRCHGRSDRPVPADRRSHDRIHRRIEMSWLPDQASDLSLGAGRPARAAAPRRAAPRPSPRKRAAGPRRDPGAGRPVVHQRGRHVHGPDRLADAARGRGGDAGRLAASIVQLEDLHDAVGKRIAELLDCEAALVTAGCASALSLATAACVAGKDPERIRRLPDTHGLKNEVIVQKTHRVGYDHAIRNAGVKMIEVETREELENAISDGPR